MCWDVSVDEPGLGACPRLSLAAHPRGSLDSGRLAIQLHTAWSGRAFFKARHSPQQARRSPQVLKGCRRCAVPISGKHPKSGLTYATDPDTSSC